MSRAYIGSRLAFKLKLGESSFYGASNYASGGTSELFYRGGERYRRHIFTTSGIFTVSQSARPFTITLVGGGAGGSGNPDGFGIGPAGGNGGFHTYEYQLQAREWEIEVGAGGSPGASNIIGGGAGSNGGNGGTSYLSDGFIHVGTWVNPMPQRAGGGQAQQAFNAGVPSAANAGYPTPQASSGVTTIDYASQGLASTVGTGGAGGGYSLGGPIAGNAGAIVIEYLAPVTTFS